MHKSAQRLVNFYSFVRVGHQDSGKNSKENPGETNIPHKKQREL
jgi:hypothetical protein